MARRSVQIEVDVDDQGAVSGVRRIEGGLKDVEGQAGQTGDEVSRMGSAFDVAIKGIAVLAVAALVREMGRLARETIGVGIEFDDTMALVQSVTGATGDEFDKMRQVAADMGRTTRFSAREAAQGMAELGRAGFDTSEVISTLPPVLNLAAATQTDLGRSAEITSDILQGFNLEAAETARIADVLTTASNNSNTTVERLGEAMSQVAPIAAGLGVGVEEATAAVGALGNAGIQASQAGTTLRAALTRLNSPVGEGADVMEQYGIELQATDGNFVGLTESIRRLESGLGDLTDSQRTAALTQIVGQRAAAGFNALIAEGSDNVEAFARQLRQSSGAAEEAADLLEDNLGGAVREASATLEGLQLQLFESFEGDSRRVVEGFTSVIRSLTGFIGDYGDQISVLARSVIPLTTATAAYVSVLIGKRVAAIGAAGAMQALNAALRANPLGLVLSALTAVATAMLVFRDNTNEATDALDEQLDSAQAVLRGIRELEGAQLAIGVTRATQELEDVEDALSGVQEELREMAGREHRIGDRRALLDRERSLQEARDALITERAVAEQRLNRSLEGRIALLRQEADAIADRSGDLSTEEQERLAELLERIADKEATLAERRQITTDTTDQATEATEENTGSVEEAIPAVDRLGDAQRRLNRVFEQVGETELFDPSGITGDMRAELADLTQGMEEFAEAMGFAPQLDSLAQVEAAIVRVNEQLDQATSQERREDLIQQREELQGTRDAMLGVEDATGSANVQAQQFADQLIGGLLRGQSAAESLSRTLDSILSQLASSAFASLLSFAAGGPATGLFGSVLGIFGGGRRYGGPVESGTVYETHGLGQREFFVPGTDGRIATSQQLSQGSPRRQRIDVRVSGTLRGDMGELVAEIDEQRTINGL